MAQKVTSGLTTANVVKQVTFATWYNSIEIINRGSTTLWVRADGVDPTVAGDECHFLPSQGIIYLPNGTPRPDVIAGVTSNCDIRMISTAACEYTVSVGS